jgi:hypothetical protein
MPVPDFSPGEVLTAAAMDSIGLWKIATVPLTSGSRVTVSNCFSSSYTNYRVVGSFNRTAGATAYAFIEMPPGSAANMTMSGFYSTWNSPTRSGDNGAAGYLFFTAAGANSFVMDIYAPNLPQSTYVQTQGSSMDYITKTDVKVANNTVFTSFDFLVGAGTFTGGSLEIYGYRK